MKQREPAASGQRADAPGEGRRSALAKIVALGAGVAGLATGLLRGRRRRGPRERELSEADLYGPHDLAG